MIGTPLSVYGFAILFGLTLPGVAMASTSPPANSAQIILRDKDNATCSLDVPAEGSGLTYQHELKSLGSKCPETFRTRSIEFVQLPSAMKIFISDDYWCSDSTASPTALIQRNEEDEPDLDTRNFWLKLKTTKKSTTVGGNGSNAGIEITYLLTYNKNTIIGPGLMLEDKYEKTGAEVRDKLSCIKLVASAAVNTPALPPIATDINRSWSDYQKEHESNFSCAGNTIMTGRQHHGDEEGKTRHECATANQSGAVVTVKDKVWSEPLSESGRIDKDIWEGKYYVCPANTIMTGREHKEDENGDTKYECATATSAGRDLTVTPHDWSSKVEETDSQFNCPANQFLIGRWHEGDEKDGQTRYRCATLQ